MKKLFIIILIMTSSFGSAQTNNIAFKDGETLNYDLYFNWKFVWMKCGTAHYSMNKSKYDGNDVYHNYLIFRTNKKFDGMFTLRDTLDCYMHSRDLRPIYYKKASLEGKKHRVEEVFYSYPDANTTKIRQHYINPNWEEEVKEATFKYQVYDMMSIMASARSLSSNNLKIGQEITFTMTHHIGVAKQRLIYKGKESMQSKDGKTYKCIVFSVLDWESKKDKELLRLYLSDDMNHLPLRIDFFLKFGSAKAFFTNGENIRYPLAESKK